MEWWSAPDDAFRAGWRKLGPKNKIPEVFITKKAKKKNIYIYIYVIGDITWLPSSIDFLCAVVSKSPLPFLSGHHIFLVPITSINNKRVLILCTPLLYNKLSKPLSIVIRHNSNFQLLIGELLMHHFPLKCAESQLALFARRCEQALTLYCLSCHTWHVQPKFWFQFKKGPSK